MRYIKTSNGRIYDTYDKHIVLDSDKRHELVAYYYPEDTMRYMPIKLDIISVADNIEDLCDECVTEKSDIDRR